MTPLLLCVLLSAGAAEPRRAPAPKPAALRLPPGKSVSQLVVKLQEDQDLVVENGRLVGGASGLGPLQALLQDSTPLFRMDPKALLAWQRAADPSGRLADLRLYLRVHGDNLLERGQALLADPRVESVTVPSRPVPPPQDLAPQTPDLRDDQTYTVPGPVGVGTDEGLLWPAGLGGGVRLADLEYGWNPGHEDLAVGERFAWGAGPMRYPCHGTMVLGMLVAPDNGYGVTGLVPEAEAVVISPFVEEGDYSLAEAIVGGASLLTPGDVFLLEQQVFANGDYAPVEAEPAVFDAIALTVASGIVVVEPAGNGGQDLDDPSWEGWFDRGVRDSGAIVVAGAIPGDATGARGWIGTSNHGSRVDLQGWGAGVTTTSHSRTVDPYCPDPDLFFPGGDGDQAYTSQFGGTSAAAPLVTAVAVAAQANALQVRGEPWLPMDLRAALVSTATAQTGDVLVGPLPDLRTFLHTWGTK